MSTGTHLADSKHMSKADSDTKTFLAYTDCFDAHQFEDLTQFVPLVETLEDNPNLISTWPHAFQWDWEVSLFKQCEMILRVNSFTDEER